MTDGFPHSVAVALGLLIAFAVSLFVLAAMAGIHSTLRPFAAPFLTALMFCASLDWLAQEQTMRQGRR